MRSREELDRELRFGGRTVKDAARDELLLDLRDLLERIAVAVEGIGRA